MSTATYTVTGMTCAHCVMSVTEEVSEVAGVTAVAVQVSGSARACYGLVLAVFGVAVVATAVDGGSINLGPSAVQRPSEQKGASASLTTSAIDAASQFLRVSRLCAAAIAMRSVSVRCASRARMASRMAASSRSERDMASGSGVIGPAGPP